MCLPAASLAHHQVLELLHPLTGGALATSVSIYGCVESAKVSREVELHVFCGVHRHRNETLALKFGLV